MMACTDSKKEVKETKRDIKKPIIKEKEIETKVAVDLSKEAVLEYKTSALLGEGAIWNTGRDVLYWVDIEGRQFHIYNPKTQINKSYQSPSMVGTVVPTTRGNVLLALQDGIYKMNPDKGKFTLFSDVESKNTANRFNDGKCDPAGRLWVGSMHLEQKDYEANLYKIDENGKATLMKDSITISNGIVWTKDEKTMYYIDTPTGEIKAFDYDRKTGSIKNERVAVVVPESLGYPDGMAIDENDHLWVGLWNGNAVAHFDPIAGELVSKIEVPAHNVTSCAFGGENLDILYITTSSLDMTPEEKEKYPLAGSLFKAVPGVKGVRSKPFNE